MAWYAALRQEEGTVVGTTLRLMFLWLPTILVALARRPPKAGFLGALCCMTLRAPESAVRPVLGWTGKKGALSDGAIKTI